MNTTVLGGRVLRYLWPYRVAFALALLQVFLISGLELLKPWPIKLIIDHVLGDLPIPGWIGGIAASPPSLLLGACAALVLIYLLLGGLQVLSDYMTIGIGQRMVHDLRGDLYSQLQRLSLSFHNRQRVGDLLYRVAADTLALQTLTMNGVFPVLSALLLLCGMFVVMMQLDWLLTLLAVSVCPALLGVIAFMDRRITFAAACARDRERDIYSVVHTAMSAMRVIQAFTKEEEERRKFMAASQNSLNAEMRLYTLQGVYSWVVNGVIALGTALVVWVAARRVLGGILTIGDMVIFTSYLASLYQPINSILQTYGLVRQAKVGVQNSFEILEQERDLLKEGHRTFPAFGAKGEISFEGVSFSYLPGQPVLRDMNLRIRPGEKVAIVGATGSGKSTLASLIPRFYDPQIGRVMLDGTDVRDFQLRSLRRQISMVLQPPLIFPLTIRENIAYSRPEATEDEIRAAARLARVEGFIEGLPAGYDTSVGEQGVTLSEGQKQRITIARAILRNAPVLILDEPTSSVDTETELLIMEALEKLLAGKTALVIAHRLSTVRWVDRIVVLRAGEIVEQGTFMELRRGPGPFASLYQSQFGRHQETRAPV